MRKAVLVMTWAWLGAGAAGDGLAAQVPPGSEALVAVAESFLRKLEAGDPEGALALAGPQMKQAGVTSQMLDLSWKQLSGGAALTELRPAQVSELQGYQVVDFEARFGERVHWFRISLDGEQRVEGFRVIPPPADTAWEPPPYARADAVEELELTVGTGDWPLGATLTLPKGVERAPVVVLVHGSGPHDRNETLGAHQPFRDLAMGLATAGVAVLRYEKRTWKHGARMVGRPITVDDEVIEDALAALVLVRAQPRVDPGRTYLLGHSLGGMLAPEIAVRDGRLAGVILLAGTPRSLPAVAIEQLDYIGGLPESATPAARDQLAALRSIMEKLLRHELAAEQDAGGAPASYFYDLERRAPALFVPRLAAPVLVLNGGRDYQVTQVDYDQWRQLLAGRSDVVFRWYDDLNHLFVAGEGRATPAEYVTGRGHVDGRVVADIAAFVQQR